MAADLKSVLRTFFVLLVYTSASRSEYHRESRAFSVSAPELWNKLPDEIRSCKNLSLFKHKLKTYLFKNFYFSHYKDVFDFISVLFKFKFMYFN